MKVRINKSPKIQEVYIYSLHSMHIQYMYKHAHTQYYFNQSDNH